MMKRLATPRRCLVIAGSVLALAAVPAEAARTPVSGSWSGDLTQGSQEYSVDLVVKSSLRPGKRAGAVDYIDLECGANLIFQRKVGKTYVFREQFTYNEGAQGCITQGATLRLTAQGGRLRFKETAGGEVVQGVLDRA
jgi:hypothetical protein